MAANNRRTYGDGALYYDERRQKWVGVVEHGRDSAGRRRRTSVFGQTKAEVRTRMAALRERQAQGLPTLDRKSTVSDLLDRWLANLPATVQSPNTRIVHEWAVEKHLRPALGRHRLHDLTPDHVENALLAMAEAGMSRSSISRIVNVLRRAIRAAERRGQVARNVAELVDVPAAKTYRSRSLSVDQAKSLLLAIADDRLEALFTVGLMLGLRPGELLGLPWSNVDLDGKLVRVTQSLLRDGKQLVIGETKTPQSRRILVMPEPVAAALRAHQAAQATERAAAPVWTDTGLVFVTSIGTPIDPANLRRHFSALTQSAGLGHWHPHELRHSAASIMSAAGVPLEVIADILGHEGVRTTSAVYRHLLEPEIRGAVEPMERLFLPRPASPPSTPDQA